jgi:hypothetical protein
MNRSGVTQDIASLRLPLFAAICSSLPLLTGLEPAFPVGVLSVLGRYLEVLQRDQKKRSFEKIVKS